MLAADWRFRLFASAFGWQSAIVDVRITADIKLRKYMETLQFLFAGTRGYPCAALCSGLDAESGCRLRAQQAGLIIVNVESLRLSALWRAETSGRATARDSSYRA